MIGGIESPAPKSYEVVLPWNINRITEILWFSLQAVMADVNDDFAALERYDLDVEFFWGISVDALSSSVWQNLIALDDKDLYIGLFTVTEKRARHTRDVIKGVTSFSNAPTVDPGLNVDAWRYSTLGERDYVARLCALPATRLKEWCGLFTVDVDSICWG